MACAGCAVGDGDAVVVIFVVVAFVDALLAFVFDVGFDVGEVHPATASEVTMINAMSSAAFRII